MVEEYESQNDVVALRSTLNYLKKNSCSAGAVYPILSEIMKHETPTFTLKNRIWYLLA